jgi:hypothetical protein
MRRALALAMLTCFAALGAAAAEPAPDWIPLDDPQVRALRAKLDAVNAWQVPDLGLRKETHYARTTEDVEPFGGLRPFNGAHLLPLDPADGVDGVAGYNTSSIVLQVPLTEVRKSTSQPVVGVWASAKRRAERLLDTKGNWWPHGKWVQDSRLGNPLINEAVIPRHLKDYWNAQPPSKDKQFKKYYERPELAALENLLYGSALEDVATTGRTDLSLILLLGVPGVNQIGTKPVMADMLRVNTAIAPCTADSAADDMGMCQRMAVMAGDVAGFPNGRRLSDDVTDIELRAIAQGYGQFLADNFGLPNKAPNNTVGDGLDSNADMPFLSSFPYIGLPHSGYEAAPPLRDDL